MRTLASFQTPRPSKNKTGTTPQIGNPSGIAITIRKFMGNLQPRPARRRRLPTLQTRSRARTRQSGQPRQERGTRSRRPPSSSWAWSVCRAVPPRCTQGEERGDDDRHGCFRWHADVGREPNRDRSDGDCAHHHNDDVHYQRVPVHEQISVWDCRERPSTSGGVVKHFGRRGERNRQAPNISHRH